jgi:hypothetical protein
MEISSDSIFQTVASVLAFVFAGIAKHFGGRIKDLEIAQNATTKELATKYATRDELKADIDEVKATTNKIYDILLRRGDK